MGKQQQCQRSRTPVPLLLPGMQLWQPRGLPNKNQDWDQRCFTRQPSSIFRGKQNAAYLAASPFLQKRAVPAGALGATSWIFSNEPGHRATGRSVTGTNLLSSYRPSGNDAIPFWCISGIRRARGGMNADDTPKAAPFQSASFPGN